MKTNTVIKKQSKTNSKVTVDKKLDQIKDIKFTSDKLEEINKHDFKLSL